jgi:uncharacterized Tic20 family protein
MSENQTQAPPPIEPLPPVPPISAPSPPPLDPENQVRMWNMFCHLSTLSICVGVPFGNILGPLLVWQIQKDKFPSTNVHGKAALNFQITVTLALLVAFAITVALMFFCVGYLLVPGVALIGLAGLVFPIIAGVKANNGESYKYPYSIDFVK